MKQSIHSLLLIFAIAHLRLLNATGVNPLDTEQRRQLIAAAGIKEDFEDRFHAEVWIADMEQLLKAPILSLKERFTILRLVHREATRTNLPPALILAVIEVESNFDRFAISESGARGLMQIMPFWLQEIGHKKDNLFDISTNLRLGCIILRHYLDQEKGNLTRALARYNGSIGQTEYPSRVYKALHRWQR